MTPRWPVMRLPIFAWGALLLTLSACGGAASLPRTTTTIAEERLQLPGLFLTASGKKKQAPLKSGPFVDAESKEIFWPALECTNPKCPGRDTEGNPFLFVHPSPGASVGTEGKIVFQKVDPSQYRSPECPECLKQRTPTTETPAERAEFLRYVQPHTLPETAEKKKQLDAEARQLLQTSR